MTVIDSSNETRHLVSGVAVARQLLAVAGAWLALLAATCIFGYFIVGPSGHGASRPVDLSIARFVARNHFGHFSGVLESFPAVGLALLVAAVGILVVRRFRTDGRGAVAPLLAIAVSGVGAYALSSTLKEIFTRARPPLALAAIADNGFSFPSSHTTVGLAMLVTLALVTGQVADGRVRRVVVIWVAALAVIVPASRLLLGVHWTTDVLIGACVGAVWGVIAYRLATRPFGFHAASAARD